MQKPEISVVIPTFNEEKNIANCLEALWNQELDRLFPEIIVVDGGSKDKTKEIVREFADKVIDQTSKGVGGARNDGAFASQGRIIATTDADCIPDSDWLRNLSAKFEEDKETVAATGSLVPVIPEYMGRSKARVYKSLFGFCNSVGYPAISKLSNHVGIGYTHLCGANSAFRRDAFEKVGGYSSLPNADDIEIVKRLMPLGKVVYARDAPVLYSVRRIEKVGLTNYVKSGIKTDFKVLIKGSSDIPDDYARQEYK